MKERRAMQASYTIKIDSIGIESPLWRWEVWLEEGNGLLSCGQTRSRRAAVRVTTRMIRLHGRQRKEEMDPYWWKEAGDAHP